MRALILLVLLLSACSSNPNPGTVETYQQRTVALCGYKPSDTTVRQLLAVKNEVLSDPDTMALAICNQVRPTPSKGLQNAS
jgi:hypothetical protein